MLTSPVRAYVDINFFRMCHLLLTDNRRNPFLALFFHFAQENLVVLIFFEILNMKSADFRFTFQLIFTTSLYAILNKFYVSGSKSKSCTFWNAFKSVILYIPTGKRSEVSSLRSLAPAALQAEAFYSLRKLCFLLFYEDIFIPACQTKMA